MTTGTFDQLARNRARRLLGVSRILKFAVLTVAAVVLLFGWGFGNRFLVTLGTTVAGMAPSTALCFVVLTAGRLLSRQGAALLADRIWPTRVGAGVVALITLANLVILATDAASGVDQFLFGRDELLDTARMSAATAINLLVLAVGFLALSSKRTSSAIVTDACGVVVVLNSMVAIVGHLMDVDGIQVVPLFTGMSIKTAIACLLLGLAMLMRQPIGGLAGVWAGSGAGSRSVRLLLPVVLLLPLIVTFSFDQARQSEWLTAGLRLSLIGLILAVSLVTVLLMSSVRQNHVDARLQRSLKTLRETVRHRDLLLAEVNHRVKNNLQQISALLYFELEDVEDPVGRRALDATYGRLNALATAHAMLQVPDAYGAPSRVDTFLRQLCTRLGGTIGARERNIKIDVDAGPEEVSPEMLNTIGLIVNEVVTNAIEHAFKGRSHGLISVRYHVDSDANEAILEMTDDGVGEGAIEPTTSGHGRQIVMALSRSLGGRLTTNSTDGHRVQITIPIGSACH